MIPQWVTKRVAKFAMKHLLGRILRNELDMEQLDVQIGSGTIHLKDLALNTNYFNDQLGEASPVVVKEGLVGSVIATNLWSIFSRDQPCEVQIHGLELVLVPRCRPGKKSDNGEDDNSRVSAGGTGNSSTTEGSEADVGGALGGGADAAYMDIEVGVRAIAQIVEKVLIGLCVKVSNLTITLEQPPQECSKLPPCTLLIRAGYVEYGNDNLHSHGKGPESNVVVKNVRFRGVTVGLLPVSNTGEKVTPKYISDHVVPVLTGADGGGVLGSIQLRIPLREGSLDIPKIITEFLVQPFKVCGSVWRIQQLLGLVQSISSSKRAMEGTTRVLEKRGERLERLVDMLSSRSVAGVEGGVAGSSVFLPATNLISDWMRWGGTDDQKIPVDMAEADLAASVDEFFECLDTGSMLLATDAWKQVEYSVKAKLVSISVEVAYEDHNKEHASGDQGGCKDSLHLRLAGTSLSMAMSEKKMDVSLTVESMELWELAQQNLNQDADDTLQGTKPDTCMELSSLIEDKLPQCGVTLFPHVKDVTFSRTFCKDVSSDKVERKQLLRVTSFQTNQGIQVNLKSYSHGGNKSGDPEGPWSMDIDTKIQPLIAWLDIDSLERIVHIVEGVSGCGLSEQGSCSGDTKSVAITTSIHLTTSISSARIIMYVPCMQTVSECSVQRTFFVLDLRSPSLDMQLLSTLTPDGDSLVFGTEEATLFIISNAVKSQDGELSYQDDLQAVEVLKIKQHGELDASVEVAWNRLAETGPWIPKQAWDVAVAQKRRGDGGGGIGGGNFEFVAAISAEAAEQADSQLREKLLKSSATVVQVKLPLVVAHISRFQYLLLIELFSFMTRVKLFSGDEHSKSSSPTSQAIPAQDGRKVPQMSVLVKCARLDMILDLSDISEALNEGSKHWDILHFDIHKTQVLSVVQMGGKGDASYLRVRHEECQVSGSPPDTWLSPLQGDTEEILLFACRNSALQRGNGGGGNVLAVGTAGITVTYVAWPGKERLADDFVIGNVKGCTIVAYGGHLEWITAVMSFFDPSDTSNSVSSSSVDDASAKVKTTRRKYCLLDLHDAALGYEPGLEALQAPEASAVACVLAAAAVRISSGDSVDSDQEQYDVRLRDIALHVLDLEFKKQAQFTYSTESMQYTGFVQVAKETSMGVTVKIGGDDAQKWEVECGNNEICFDTCHDTTAACERLVAQLQQLFAPPMEQQSVQIKMHKMEVKAADIIETPDLLDGVLENAFVSLRDLQSEPLDLESSGLSNKDIQEFIEDYVSEHTPGGLSEHSEDSPRSVSEPTKTSIRGGASGGGWYEDNALNIVDDHVPADKPEVKPSLPKKYPKSVGRMILQNMSLKWRLHEGSDWPFGDEESDWNLAGAVGDGGRKPNVCLEVFLNGINVQYDAFPSIGLYASRLTVTVSNFGILDCSPDAPWKTVMGYHHVPSRPRETSSQALKIDMDAVRPDPTDILEEYRVSFALLPIRLHLDQRHLDFCTKFFSSQFGVGQGTLLEENLNLSSRSSLSSTPSVSSNLTDSPTEPLLPFFQIFEVLPFNIRVDYLPRRVDLAALRAGNYVELVNMVQWKGIELQLKHVKAKGVHGLSSFSKIFLNEWLQDIFQNQLFKFVQGAGPIRPLYAVGSGAAKLVVSPAQHYWKEHRLLHEVRKHLKRVSSLVKREKRDGKQSSPTT